MKKLLVYLKPYRRQAILGPIFKLVEAVLELLVPLLVADIIDRGVAARSVSYILERGGLMLLLGVLGLAAALICQYYAVQASEGCGKSLRGKIYQKVNSFSSEELERFGLSSLAHRVIGDTERVKHGVAMGIRVGTRAPFLTIGSLVMACIVAPRLAPIFLIASALIAGFLYFLLRRQARLYRKLQVFLDSLAARITEALSGARVIRAFRRERETQSEFDRENEAFARDNRRAEAISVLLHPVTSIFINGAIAAVIWFGGISVHSGSLQTGQIVALMSYLSQILLAMMAVANLLVIFTRAAASAARINAVLDTEPAVVSPEQPLLPDDAQKEAVRFSDVSFSYAGATGRALNDLNFAVKRGETLGIIGGTGSGKSTLAALLMRFYEASAGSVRVFGRDVRDWDLEKLRARIGLVSQNFVLFTGTLRENLAFGKPQATEAALWRALESAQATDFVRKLPQGLDTPLTRGGKNLSGGQRQRIAIARALVKEPRILVLDDSASALDYATDAALRRALHKTLPGATKIIISQRVSAVREADRILVLDHGAVCGLDCHAALQKSCGVYAEICASQEEGAAS